MGKRNAAPWRPKRTERLLRGSVAHSFSSKTSFSVTKESKEEEKRETRISDTQVRSLRPLAVILGHLPLVGGTALYAWCIRNRLGKEKRDEMASVISSGRVCRRVVNLVFRTSSRSATDRLAFREWCGFPRPLRLPFRETSNGVAEGSQNPR